jgi:hypothetical protein
MRRTAKTAGKVKAKPSSARGKAEKTIELPGGTWERISRKAYELWEQRGRQEGSAFRDWLEAEEIVMEEIRETRE